MKAKTVMEPAPMTPEAAPAAEVEQFSKTRTAGAEPAAAKQTQTETTPEKLPGIIGELHPLPLEEVILRIEERLDDC